MKFILFVLLFALCLTASAQDQPKWQAAAGYGSVGWVTLSRQITPSTGAFTLFELTGSKAVPAGVVQAIASVNDWRLSALGEAGSAIDPGAQFAGGFVVSGPAPKIPARIIFAVRMVHYNGATTPVYGIGVGKTF